MGKILRIIDSKYLPPFNDRDPKVVYFVYDKMAIYLGKNFYSDPFCIVESIPQDPVEGMLYITLNGELKSYVNHKIIDIGEIESEDQLEYLKKAGTIYFMKAEYRYLDLQTRTLQLPFQNGTYQLTVSMTKDIIIDEDTVIRYNPETRQFEISSVIDDEESTEDPFSEYKGSVTSTVKTTVKNKQIQADVIVSPNENNLIQKLGNGLYANINDLVKSEDFENLVLAYNAYKTAIDGYIAELEKELENVEFNLDNNTIANKILEELKKYEPTIDDMFANYEYIYNQLGLLRESVVNYTDKKIEETKTEIIEYITNIVNAWEEFDYEGTDSSSISSMLDQDEMEIQSLLLEKMREQFVMLRECDGEYTESVDFFMVTDNAQFNNTVDIQVLPKLLSIVSEQASKVGYTRVILSTKKETDNNHYYWKITEKCPKYHDDITKLEYNYWDGISDLEIPNGSVVILVETNSRYRAIKFGKFVANSRLEALKELDILNIISVEGSRIGNSILMVSPEKEENNIYMYKKATTIPEFNSILPTDYVEWDGVSELNLEEHDMEVMCLVECTKDLHRALKIGLVRVDLANELLKLLTVTSEYGESSYYSNIKIAPKLIDGNSYYFKLSDNTVLPAINTYANDGSWTVLDSDQKIYNENFLPYIIVVECDSNNRVKKAGYTELKTNNELTLSLSYNENEYLKNDIYDYEYHEGTDLYYKVIDSSDTQNHLYYGEIIPESFNLLNYNTESIEFTIGSKIVIAEVYTDSNKVRRFGIFEPTIEYAEDIEFIGEFPGNSIIIPNEVYDPNYQYAVQLLFVDDEQPILNRPIEISDEYIAWDGESEIPVSHTTNLKGYRLYKFIDNKVKYSGKNHVFIL